MSESSPVPEPFESRRFLAALAAEEPEEVPRSERLQRWYERAAVLAWFEPYMIGAPASVERLLEDEDWMALIADCEIARTARDGPRRRLTLAKRRECLARLHGREGLKNALQETKERPSQDPLQQALDWLIQGETIHISALTQPELYGLHTASVWLEGLIDGLPEPTFIALRLRREELLQPHRLLVGRGFLGRKDELDDLRSYVQEIRASRIWTQVLGATKNLARSVLSQPPLVIFGPGGVGKSTLGAQFILEHAEKSDLVFVDLDFGRPNLDPRRPVTLLAEAARQIATQVPTMLSEGDALALDLDLAAATVTWGSEESLNVIGRDEAIRRFCRFAASALPTGRKVPFVLDTFEEVETLGQTRVESVWNLLRELQIGLPQLRPVICSRVPPPASWAPLNLQLRELEPEAGARYLDARLHGLRDFALPPMLTTEAARRVTGTPLALNLAAELLVQAMDAGEDPASVLAQIRGKADEAFLYGRILKQIRDPEVQRLATPGLAVRRLDSGVVLEVLAEPCGVEVKDLEAAETLLNRLASQVALVERLPDGSLLHRADVRRLMLPAIEESEGLEVVRQIDRRAAEYYKRDEGIVSRTERVYHLLRLGDLATAEPLLNDEVAQRLRVALDELGPDARLVLGLRLGITPGPEELQRADQARWEWGALAAAQDFLGSGDYQRVLSLLKSGLGRRPGGPLDRIEAEALIGIGDWAGALQLVQSGMAAAQRDGQRASALELSLVMARIGFATADLGLVAKAVGNAEALTTAADPADTRLRILTASIRLARLRSDRQRVEELAQCALALLTPSALARLSPSVLRELAGELAPEHGTFGDAAGSVLRTALRRLGIEHKTQELIEGLATTISGWLATGGAGATDVVRVLSGISGAPPVPIFSDREAWRRWLNAIPGFPLGNALATLLKAPHSGATEKYAVRLQELLAGYIHYAAVAAGGRPSSTITVDPSGHGDFATLTDALNAAESGDTILVRPGLYKEGVVIDKSVDIIGDGKGREVVIEATGKSAVLFKASMGRIANLTLRQTGSGDWYCIDIAEGRLNLEECDITSQSGACVGIHGTADPHLRRNSMHNGKRGGVYVYDNGQGMLEDNDIHHNALAGVAVNASGNLILRRNRIHDGDKEGVFVWNGGQGTLENNDIYANKFAGVALRTGSNVTIRGNRIRDGKKEGVYVDNAQGILENNRIYGNALAGVEIKSGGFLTVRLNSIIRNAHTAVRVHDGGSGIFEENDLRRNAKGAWDISPDSLDKVTRAHNREELDQPKR